MFWCPAGHGGRLLGMFIVNSAGCFHAHLGTAVKHGFLGVDLTAFGAISGRLVLCRPGFSFGPDPEIMGPDQ